MTQALIEIMQRYRITLPPNAMEWRVPPEETSGYIIGITVGSVRLLCLDGIVAWFANSDGSLLFGHMQHFVSDKKERTSRGEAVGRTKRPSAKKQILLDLATELGIEL